MTMRIPLRCRCGEVRGSLAEVSRGEVQRAECYCDDCQIYALHLGRPDVLDERGGTDGLIATPAQLSLERGRNHVRCLRLSPKGPYRFYADCCNTPLVNTPKARSPFVIIPNAALDFAAVGTSPEGALGPAVIRVQARFAKGGVPAGAHPKLPLRVVPIVARHVLRALIKRRTRPSPFFDDRGVPCAEPQILDRGEREALREKVLADARA